MMGLNLDLIQYIYVILIYMHVYKIYIYISYILESNDKLLFGSL